jgi:hypothetical protein
MLRHAAPLLEAEAAQPCSATDEIACDPLLQGSAPPCHCEEHTEQWRLIQSIRSSIGTAVKPRHTANRVQDPKTASTTG